jgi:ATP-dependent DNA helicase RecQ
MSIHQILKEYWGYDSFRPLQQEIIESILNGKDTLALLPTGGGKSICFQVPAMAKGGLCLVITPLIALMKDQVERLRKKRITAFAIYSGMRRIEVINTLKVATESNCKFLYVSPERLETSLFKEYLPALDINLIAVDEAHCISQWGYDFRPPYLRISALREELPGVPVLALTASATQVVQQDICEKLQFQQHTVFRQSFERPNLSYSSFKVDSKIVKILEILKKVPGSGIVYCKSRKRTKEISDLLNMHGIRSDYYHAGQSQEERNNKQENWINNSVPVIVCTNAFGMGIDKADVRVVIHADVPDSLENYYQEAGRAGRNGKKAYAVLLNDSTELDDLKQLPDIRFPSLENIRIVYQSLMNYLQVPSGSAEGDYYDFSIAEFMKRFKLDARLVVNALQALQQEGYLDYNEQVFIPSSVQFTTTKEILYAFEKANPGQEPIIKILLRNYEGIFDRPATIHEKTIARLLQTNESDCIQQLKKLHLSGILDYTPQKDKPQIYFIEQRVKAEDLQIAQENYRQRKKQCEERIETLLKYIQDNEKCRSQTIAAYFGDSTVKPCGICDNCIEAKKDSLTTDEFNSIHQSILHALQNQLLHHRDLLDKLNGIKKEKVWKVLKFLQSENKITVNGKGEVGIRQTKKLQ